MDNGSRGPGRSLGRGLSIWGVERGLGSDGLGKLLHSLLHHLCCSRVDRASGGHCCNTLRSNDSRTDRLIGARRHYKSTNHKNDLTVVLGELNRADYRQHTSEASPHAGAANTGNPTWSADAIAGGAGKFSDNIGNHVTAGHIHPGPDYGRIAPQATKSEFSQGYSAALLNAKRIAIDTKVQIYE